ncbi:hypothetical protein PM082_021407 [Marasmius tenuissimus]|nr:hypothetical protein PM082_021407 [Marasmius tenuissimus]
MTDGTIRSKPVFTVTEIDSLRGRQEQKASKFLAHHRRPHLQWNLLGSCKTGGGRGCAGPVVCADLVAERGLKVLINDTSGTLVLSGQS